ncbi:MAG TPA: hypothetical protein DCX32_01085 [Candidatus Moranbacteria bacterium]|nr:hypothetical protein [Candidatus Moranbacteria bacterium]
MEDIGLSMVAEVVSRFEGIPKDDITRATKLSPILGMPYRLYLRQLHGITTEKDFATVDDLASLFG